MPRHDADPRWRWLGLLAAAGFALTGFTQVRVQATERDAILREAEQASHTGTEAVLLARRGAVLARDGSVLAQSVDGYALGLDYTRVPKSPGFMLALADAAGLSQTELATPGLVGKRSRLWPRPLSARQAARVRQVRRDWDADGVSLERVPTRQYPLGEAAAGVVGALREGVPVLGIEAGQDLRLSGQDGKSEGFVDRTGAWIETVQDSERRNGSQIRLTIDPDLQVAAAEAVRRAVESNRASSGSAVLIDPKTGDVLAMANWPSFDPSGPPSKTGEFNSCVMGAYEPGSTFKILTLAEALDAKSVTPGWTTACTGSVRVGPETIHCAHGAHGTVDLEQAIAESCNVAATRWALAMGRDRMVGFLDASGLLIKPGLGLAGESKGIFNRDEYGRQVQLATLGFGQSVSTVPVNLAAAFASLANGGVMMPPRLILAVDGVEPPRATGKRLFSEETAGRVLGLMESVIAKDFGTGKSLRLPGYRLAGKTGTAQKVGSATGKYVANFVGVVPADDPKALVLVMVDSPSAGRYYGGEVAGPPFLEIAKAIVRHYAIPPAGEARR